MLRNHYSTYVSLRYAHICKDATALSNESISWTENRIQAAEQRKATDWKDVLNYCTLCKGYAATVAGFKQTLHTNLKPSWNYKAVMRVGAVHWPGTRLGAGSLRGWRLFWLGLCQVVWGSRWSMAPGSLHLGTRSHVWPPVRFYPPQSEGGASLWLQSQTQLSTKLK